MTRIAVSPTPSIGRRRARGARPPDGSAPKAMTQFAAYTIIGLSLGGIFALAALGIVLIYRVTGVLNFAHGAMGMFSTFVAWQVFYGSPHPGMGPWGGTAEAIGAGLLFALVLGLVLELAVFRWVRNRPQITKAVITIGVLLALQSA